ncbi:MAG TPA: PP2C family protein-serine/threonine phosphatase [Terracidiphilus sp.]|nr:PP2C family protein-serine/threonine phosphatase [Terracidiphilus sp.]
MLQITADASYEVFLNGSLLARSGSVRTGAHTAGVVNQYDSPAFAQKQPFLLAARLTYSPTLYGQRFLPWILLGDAGLIRDKYSAQVLRALRSRWIVWTCNAVMAVAGLFFLILYLFDRSQRVLLWASLTWLALALIRFDEFLLAASVHLPSRMEYLLYSVGSMEEVFYIAFFFALAGRRINTFFRVLMGISFVDVATLVVAALLPLRESVAMSYWFDMAPLSNSFLGPMSTLIAFAPLAAFWPIQKLPRSQLALYCVCSFWMGMDVLYHGSQIPWLHFGTYFFLSFQSVRSVAIAGVVVAMTLLLIQRIRQTNRERAALATEMRAAREIQRILVPQGIESAAGLKVEAVFLPAQEVGGDFYRCRVLADGSQWVLLGDVSGKGIAAGMTGAMLLGACEGHESEEPAQVLGHLNRALCSSGVGGLATCVCARIALEGLLTIANAGHLPPYRNGEEMEIEGGLPLGVAMNADYREKQIQLEPGDVLTFLSDGVVEAQSSAKELFGFERTRKISHGTAQEIAEAAQHFGQQDDITVLKLMLEPAEAFIPIQ